MTIFNTAILPYFHVVYPQLSLKLLFPSLKAILYPTKKVIAPLSSSFQFFLVTWYTEHPENRDRTGANQFLFPGTLTLSSTMSISDFFC